MRGLRHCHTAVKRTYEVFYCDGYNIACFSANEKTFWQNVERLLGFCLSMRLGNQPLGTNKSPEFLIEQRRSLLVQMVDVHKKVVAAGESGIPGKV